jgi:flagellar basal-body rod modification protein FlgD
MGLAPTVTNSGIAPTTPVPAIATAATLPSSETSTVLSSDFETFLKMLTAQAQYQDPLEPIDSSEYAAQLAQFSMVEQQVLANDRLAELTAQMTISNMTQMASLIGMEARTAEAVYFDGSSITIDPDPAEGAEKTVLVVSNSEGFVVQRTEIPVSDDPIKWSGRGDNGVTLTEGFYSFELESSSAGDVISTLPASTFTRITEARSTDGAPSLILQGDTEVLAINVNGLRSPS